METNSKKILVAIVTYNGSQYIKKCLKSISSTLHTVDIGIVDNSSSDDTLEIVKEMFLENVTVIESQENLGFGRANNRLINIAINNPYDYIFLLNQDAYFIQNSLDRLINFAENHGDLNIISPIHLSHKNGLIEKGFENRLNVGTFSNGIITSNFVNAAAWLIPKATLHLIGGFSPLFYHYGEDNDYANRLIYNQLKFIICPTGYVVHDRLYKTLADYAYNPETSSIYLDKMCIHIQTLLADINCTTFYNFCRVLKVYFGLIKKDLIRGSSYNVIPLTLKTLSVILNMKPILKHRKAAKKQGAFLNALALSQ